MIGLKIIPNLDSPVRKCVACGRLEFFLLNICLIEPLISFPSTKFYFSEKYTIFLIFSIERFISSVNLENRYQINSGIVLSCQTLSHNSYPPLPSPHLFYSALLAVWRKEARGEKNNTHILLLSYRLFLGWIKLSTR